VKRCLEILLAMVLFVPVFALAPAASTQAASETIAISAVVQPHIYLVVDSSGEIRQIYSNSHQESEPLVMLGSLSGSAGAMTTDIAAQYANLRPALDFSKSGHTEYGWPNWLGLRTR